MNKVLTNINQGLSALEKQTARENIGAENASNRVTTIDENSTDTQYPSAKCVFGALQNVGGGYADGGQLVDGDFIEVENNTISTYDNTTRSDVNFYFEVADGEVINSVVELTTTVNATIHVYILQNGFYIPLGNIGGDTVIAGNDYNLTVVGNSFILEVVTPSQAIPEFAVINNQTIKVYASLDKTVLFTSNDSLGFFNNENAIKFSKNVGWDILDNSVRSKFEGANIPLDNSGYYDGVSWVNQGTRAIIFNGWSCQTARGYENFSSNPQGGDYGTSSPVYLCSLVLYKYL